MSDFLTSYLESLASAAFVLLVYAVVRRVQRLNPRFETHEGRRCLVISPNRAMLAVLVFGFFFLGALSVGWCAIVLSRFSRTWGGEPVVIAFALFLAIFVLAMTGVCLCYSLHFWRSRILVFKDGLLFMFLLRKRTFSRWSDLERVEYRAYGHDIIIFSQHSRKLRIDSHWNGIAFLFFCLDSFLPEDQWREAKKGIEEVLRKKGNLDDIRSQLADLLLNHPLDSFDLSVQPSAEEIVSPS